jgi:hypothetical protein
VFLRLCEFLRFVMFMFFVYLAVLGRTKEAQVAEAHAVLSEVGGEGVKPITNVGNCIPVDNDCRLQCVSKCEGLLDCVSQFFTIEAVVVPDSERISLDWAYKISMISQIWDDILI